MPPEGPRHPAAETPGQPSWIAPIKPVVPDHELLKRIGGGSYGDVWLARSVVGTWRAVKVVFRDRFLDARPYEREFKGMQKFEPLSRSNEGFIDILQIGRNDAEGYFYYVMELADDAVPVPGGTSSARPHSPPRSDPELSGTRVTRPSEAGANAIDPETYVPKTLAKALLQRGRLPVSECLELGITLNLALAHLHHAGLIHRDIKPSNLIFVGGVPKLADIGLVIEFAEARSYVGTEGFIPPEGPNSPQADLYSLGKVLYEAGMGKDRKEFPEPLTQLVEAPDAPELLEFNAILLKACAANVKDRYQSAEEMNADLALLQSGGSVRKQRTLTRRLRFVQRAGAAVTALAAFIALGWLWQARQTHIVRELAAEKSALAEQNRERVVRLDIANGVRLMEQDDLSGALLWFADALPRVSDRASEEEIHRIRIQQTLAASPRLLRVVAENETITASAFSPDGRRFATATLGSNIVVREGNILERESNVAVWDSLSGELLWKLPHSRKALFDLRFDRDGRRLFISSVTTQGTVAARPPPELELAEVIDVESGRPLFPAVDSNLMFSAFSPDDRWLAIAFTNHIIELLDTRDGRVIAEITGHTNNITTLAFSADGSLLASASRDRTVRIWRMPGGEPAGEPIPHDEDVEGVAWSADGRYIATAIWKWKGDMWKSTGEDPKESAVQVWNAANGQKVGPTITEVGFTRALFFSPIGETRLFTGGQAGNVRVWTVGTSVSLDRTLQFKTTSCWAFSPDGRQLALGAEDGSVSLWSTGSWELLFPPFRHTGRVGSVHFNPDDTRLLTSSEDATAKLWTLRYAPEAARLALSADFHDVPARFQRPRGRSPGPIPIPLPDKGLHLIDPDRLIDTKTLEPLHTITRTNTLPPNYIAGSSGRHWALWWTPESKSPQELTLWTLREGAFQPLALPHPEGIWLAQFSGDDSQIVTLGVDEVFRIWRTRDGTLERTVRKPKELAIFSSGVLLEPFDPSLRRIVGVIGLDSLKLENEFIQLLDLTTGQFTGKPFPALRIDGDSTRLRLSPDGTRLANVGTSGTAAIINLQAGELAAPPSKHGGQLVDVEWSRDGKQFLTSGCYYNVEVWDASTGEMMGAPMEGVASAHWSADGRFIATRGDDKLVRVYDAATTEPVTPALPHSGYIRWVCITPSNRLISASDPNLLRAWDLKPTPLAPDIIADYAKFLSGRRLSAGGLLLPIPAKELAKLAQSLRIRAPQLFE